MGIQKTYTLTLTPSIIGKTMLNLDPGIKQYFVSLSGNVRCLSNENSKVCFRMLRDNVEIAVFKRKTNQDSNYSLHYLDQELNSGRHEYVITVELMHPTLSPVIVILDNFHANATWKLT